MDRREFLRRAGLSGPAMAAVAAGLPRPAAATDAELAPFFHGIASGDPLPDRVVLWTRVTPAPEHDGRDIAVEWELALDPEMTQIVMSGETWATGASDYTVKIDPSGLAPYTYYFYRFRALGKHSLTGRTKTAAAAGQSVEHLRLGVVSCANYQQGWFNAYARLAERDDLDAIIHTGDYIYEYEDGGYGPGSAIGRGHDPAVEMTQLEHYRLRHAQYKQDPDLRRLHQLFPFVTTWDDHESANNSWRDGAANHNDGEGNWPERKLWCQQSYDEWMPIRSSGDPALIYRRLQWGDLVDVIVMDTRLEGRDQQATFIGTETEAIGGLLIAPDTSDPNRHIVSPTQMEWVKQQLSESRAQWKLMAQQVIVSQWNLGATPLLPEGVVPQDFPRIIRDGGNAMNADAWDGYQADRARLLSHIRENQIDNIVVLTGDVHSSWAFDVTEDPANPAQYNPLTGDGSLAVEFVCPAVASESLGDTFNSMLTDGASNLFDLAMHANNPQMKYLESTSNGFIVLDVTPERVQADWFFVDVSSPNDAETLGESWQALAGSNRLIAADGPAASKPSESSRPTATAPSQERSTSQKSAGGSLGLASLATLGLASALHQRRKQIKACGDKD